MLLKLWRDNDKRLNTQYMKIMAKLLTIISSFVFLIFILHASCICSSNNQQQQQHEVCRLLKFFLTTNLSFSPENCVHKQTKRSIKAMHNAWIKEK